jgi:hypothetical protein
MERAGDLLNAFFRFHNIAGGDEYVSFFSSWHEIVGTDLAAHTQPIDIRGEALVVEVDHPGWMQMLQLQKDRILQRISAHYNQLGVSNLHMKLVEAGQFSGPDAIQEQAEQERARARQEQASAAGQSADSTQGSRPEASQDEHEALSRVGSDKLRETLERLRKDLNQK